MPVPDFSPGEVLTASAMDSIGLWKINSYSLTSGGSVTLTNCFPSGYRRFRLVGQNIDTSGDGGVFIQFTTTGNLHYGSLFYDGYGGGATGTVRQNNAQQMEIALVDNANFAVDVINPNQAVQTTWFGNYFGRSLYAGWCGGMHNSATAYSSCNITLGGTGITFVAGTVVVYGYRD